MIFGVEKFRIWILFLSQELSKWIFLYSEIDINLKLKQVWNSRIFSSLNNFKIIPHHKRLHIFGRLRMFEHFGNFWIFTYFVNVVNLTFLVNSKLQGYHELFKFVIFYDSSALVKVDEFSVARNHRKFWSFSVLVFLENWSLEIEHKFRMYKDFESYYVFRKFQNLLSWNFLMKTWLVARLGNWWHSLSSAILVQSFNLSARFDYLDTIYFVAS